MWTGRRPVPVLTLQRVQGDWHGNQLLVRLPRYGHPLREQDRTLQVGGGTN